MKAFFSPVIRLVGFYGILLTFAFGFTTNAQVSSVLTNVTSTNVLAKLPVGDEGFFRTEGAKLVRFVHVDLTLVDNPDFPEQIGAGWGYPYSEDINLDGSWTEAQLLALGKESAATHLEIFGSTAFQKRPGSKYLLKVRWSPVSGSPFYLFAPFRYHRTFTPVKGTDGTWHPPAWVTNSMKMEFSDYVFMPFPGATEVKLRWFENGKFQPPYSYPANISLQRAGKSGQENGEIFPLPTNPLIKGLLGVLTVKGKWGEENILRYHTGAGAKFEGVQGEREPLMVGLRRESRWIRIVPSGDYQDISTLIFERSNDLKVWNEIVDGIDGGLIDIGMGVIPKTPEFYRARYKQ
jgi:hypothetical protein